MSNIEEKNFTDYLLNPESIELFTSNFFNIINSEIKKSSDNFTKVIDLINFINKVVESAEQSKINSNPILEPLYSNYITYLTSLSKFYSMHYSIFDNDNLVIKSVVKTPLISGGNTNVDVSGINYGIMNNSFSGGKCDEKSIKYHKNLSGGTFYNKISGGRTKKQKKVSYNKKNSDRLVQEIFNDLMN